MPDADHPSALRSTLLIVAVVLVVVGLTVGGMLLLSQKQPAGQPRPASGRPTVAVLAFENHTGDARFNWYGANAAELLAADLARLPDVEVISRQRIYDVLREMNLAEKAPALDANAATGVARKSGATLLVRGETLLLSGSITLKAEVVDVATGKLLDAEQVTGVDDQNLLAKVDELGGLIAEKLKTSR